MSAIFTYNVTQTIDFTFEELIHEAVCTYDIHLEKRADKNFKIKLRQSNYKLNGEIVAKKFEKIVQEYTSSLFPVLFDKKENSFLLCNFSEIKERIIRKDEELKLKHEGLGLDFIRHTFLDLVQDGNKMVAHLFSFGLIKVIFSCIQKLESNSDFEFQWDLNLIDFTGCWKGKKTFDPVANSIQYNGTLSNTSELLESLKDYALKYNIPFISPEQEREITTSITHEIQFVTEELDFETSLTTASIQINSFFDYKETFSISSFQNI